MYASTNGLDGSILTDTDLAFALPEFAIKTVILLFSLSSRSSIGFDETYAISSVVVPSTLKTIASSVDHEIHRDMAGLYKLFYGVIVLC